MTVDILAFAAHPDDAELSCAGTLLRHKALGQRVGIVDLTRGQLGSRGTPQTRTEEAKAASDILGLDVRDNLGMQDGWFAVDEDHVRSVAKSICTYRPQVVLCNAIRDRHPDHGRGAELVSQAAFYSGLAKLDLGLEAWRPKVVLHYIQDRPIEPDLVIDITAHMETKMAAILAYKTQFYDPESEEPETPISSKEFLEVVKARAREMGRYIGVEFAEGYTTERAVGLADLMQIS